MKAKKQNKVRASDFECKIEMLEPGFFKKMGITEEPADLTPAHIVVAFDIQLAKIVGTMQTTAMVNNGHPFKLFFSYLLQDYPKITEMYSPSQLGFTLNGERPADDAKLRDGDRLCFMVTR